MAKKRNMEKCKTCVNLDREKTNHNWTVYPVMPVSVMMNGSENCEKYIEREHNEVKA